MNEYLKLSKRILVEIIKSRNDELKIVYELADNMYGALMSYQNEISSDISPRLCAAQDYYDWVHAGEPVAEDINDP